MGCSLLVNQRERTNEAENVKLVKRILAQNEWLALLEHEDVILTLFELVEQRKQFVAGVVRK